MVGGLSAAGGCLDGSGMECQHVRPEEVALFLLSLPSSSSLLQPSSSFYSSFFSSSGELLIEKESSYMYNIYLYMPGGFL